jgi:hypothetical protein
MTISAAVTTVSNLELSPMRVTYNNVDLGGTLKNVTVQTEFSKADMHMDQLGDTVVNRKVTGLKISVAMELAEVKAKANWKVAFPHMKLVTSGGNKMGYFQSMVGDDDLSNAHILVLHPLSLGDADLSGDFKFFLAIPDAKSSIVYGPKDQATLKLTFNILPDTGVVPPKFFIHGDPSIGLVAAAAAAAVPGSNTGDGTVGSVVAYSGYTKTETITLTCVTAVTNGGVFEVHGSLSGPLGLATVGVSFAPVNGPISFTIADGTTDFIVGDSFTIATTAANYA